MFSTGKQAADVAAVPNDDQHRRQYQREKNEGVLKSPEPHQDWKGGRSNDGAQGDVARERDDDEKDRDCNTYLCRSESKKCTHAGGHTFAAMKAKPHWEHVSDDRKQRRKRGNGIGPAGVQSGVWTARDHFGDQHGRESFKHVEQQSKYGETLCAGARHIRGANIATAALPDIRASEDAHE